MTINTKLETQYNNIATIVSNFPDMPYGKIIDTNVINETNVMTFLFSESFSTESIDDRVRKFVLKRTLIPEYSSYRRKFLYYDFEHIKHEQEPHLNTEVVEIDVSYYNTDNILKCYFLLDLLSEIYGHLRRKGAGSNILTINAKYTLKDGEFILYTERDFYTFDIRYQTDSKGVSKYIIQNVIGNTTENVVNMCSVFSADIVKHLDFIGKKDVNKANSQYLHSIQAFYKFCKLKLVYYTLLCAQSYNDDIELYVKKELTYAFINLKNSVQLRSENSNSIVLTKMIKQNSFSLINDKINKSNKSLNKDKKKAEVLKNKPTKKILYATLFVSCLIFISIFVIYMSSTDNNTSSVFDLAFILIIVVLFIIIKYVVKWNSTEKFNNPITYRFPRIAATSNNFTYPDVPINVRISSSSGTNDYTVFDRNSGTHWISAASTYSNGDATRVYYKDYKGEYICIDLGKPITLHNYKLVSVNATSAPKDFRVYGTNEDGAWGNPEHASWKVAHEVKGAVYTNNVASYDTSKSIETIQHLSRNIIHVSEKKVLLMINNNSVYVAGPNNGKIGLNHKDEVPWHSPHRVLIDNFTPLSDVVNVLAGEYCLFLKKNGTVLSTYNSPYPQNVIGADGKRVTDIVDIGMLLNSIESHAIKYETGSTLNCPISPNNCYTGQRLYSTIVKHANHQLGSFLLNSSGEVLYIYPKSDRFGTEDNKIEIASKDANGIRWVNTYHPYYLRGISKTERLKNVSKMFCNDTSHCIFFLLTDGKVIFTMIDKLDDFYYIKDSLHETSLKWQLSDVSKELSNYKPFPYKDYGDVPIKDILSISILNTNIIGGYRYAEGGYNDLIKERRALGIDEPDESARYLDNEHVCTVVMIKKDKRVLLKNFYFSPEVGKWGVLSQSFKVFPMRYYAKGMYVDFGKNMVKVNQNIYTDETGVLYYIDINFFIDFQEYVRRMFFVACHEVNGNCKRVLKNNQNWITLHSNIETIVDYISNQYMKYYFESNMIKTKKFGREPLKGIMSILPTYNFGLNVKADSPNHIKRNDYIIIDNNGDVYSLIFTAEYTSSISGIPKKTYELILPGHNRTYSYELTEYDYNFATNLLKYLEENKDMYELDRKFIQIFNFIQMAQLGMITHNITDYRNNMFINNTTGGFTKLEFTHYAQKFESRGSDTGYLNVKETITSISENYNGGGITTLEKEGTVVPYRYYSLVTNKLTGNDTQLRLSEWEMYGKYTAIIKDDIVQAASSKSIQDQQKKVELAEKILSDAQQNVKEKAKREEVNAFLIQKLNKDIEKLQQQIDTQGITNSQKTIIQNNIVISQKQLAIAETNKDTYEAGTEQAIKEEQIAEQTLLQEQTKLTQVKLDSNLLFLQNTLNKSSDLQIQIQGILNKYKQTDIQKLDLEIIDAQKIQHKLDSEIALAKIQEESQKLLQQKRDIVMKENATKLSQYLLAIETETNYGNLKDSEKERILEQNRLNEKLAVTNKLTLTRDAQQKILDERNRVLQNLKNQTESLTTNIQNINKNINDLQLSSSDLEKQIEQDKIQYDKDIALLQKQEEDLKESKIREINKLNTDIENTRKTIEESLERIDKANEEIASYNVDIPQLESELSKTAGQIVDKMKELRRYKYATKAIGLETTIQDFNTKISVSINNTVTVISNAIILSSLDREHKAYQRDEENVTTLSRRSSNNVDIMRREDMIIEQTIHFISNNVLLTSILLILNKKSQFPLLSIMIGFSPFYIILFLIYIIEVIRIVRTKSKNKYWQKPRNKLKMIQ